MGKLRLGMKQVRDTARCEPKLRHHPAPGSICHSVTTQPPPDCCRIHLHVQHLLFPGHTRPTLAGLSLRPAQIHSTAPSGWKVHRSYWASPQGKEAFLALVLDRSMTLRALGGAGVSQAAATHHMELLSAWCVTSANGDVLWVWNTPQHAETLYANKNAEYQVNNLYIDCMLKW